MPSIDPLDQPCECLTQPEPKGKVRDCPTCMYFRFQADRAKDLDVNEFCARMDALIRANGLSVGRTEYTSLGLLNLLRTAPTEEQKILLRKAILRRWDEQDSWKLSDVAALFKEVPEDEVNLRAYLMRYLSSSPGE